MIDAKEARRVTERCIEVSREFWRIDQNWQVRFVIERLDAESAAENQLDVTYRKSKIYVDPGKSETIEDLWAHVAHEVIHILLGEYCLFRDAAMRGKPDDDVGHDLFTHADERTVSQLEQVFVRECPYAEYGVEKKNRATVPPMRAVKYAP